MLVWDETDVLTCLEVMPEIEPDGIWHKYTVLKHGMRLELTVYQYDGDVFLDLYRDGIEKRIFSMKLINCPGVRYVKDKKGEHLEFAHSQAFASRYDGESTVPFGVRLGVNPTISIELY